MRKRLLIGLAVCLGGLALADDKKDPALAPIAVAKLDRKEPVAFEKDVAPILANKCQVCHAGNLTEGKLDLGTHAGLMKGGKKASKKKPAKQSKAKSKKPAKKKGRGRR